ncbi:MAG: hypothetical protein ACREE4_22885 [Stellaceae bacterium]
MRKRDFRKLFLRALELAAEEADARFGQRVPRSFLVELHAWTSGGKIMSLEGALDEIYLSDNRFYRIIDIAAKNITSDRTIAFVRVSGHPPGPFSQTWDPANLGPFKQIFAETIEDRQMHA